mmetsp:Transcript_103279/g.274696  ORF Transcript_103279/g.274696 Transcript_103279/m.274696 type:complete len:83 (-) Transcript_103279:46-294(-)
MPPFGRELAVQAFVGETWHLECSGCGSCLTILMVGRRQDCRSEAPLLRIADAEGSSRGGSSSSAAKRGAWRSMMGWEGVEVR